MQFLACRQRLYYHPSIHGAINNADPECICYVECRVYDRVTKELRADGVSVQDASYTECMLVDHGNQSSSVSIRVYIAPIDGAILRLYDANHVDENIYIPPKVMNSLQILGNSNRVTLHACDRDSNIADEIVLSRIKGAEYPASNEVENAVIKRYFRIQRLLNVGDVIAIPSVSMDEHRPQFNAHDVDDLCVYWYSVHRLGTDNKSIESSAMNIPGTSKLVLQGFSASRMPDINMSTFIAALDLRDFICNRREQLIASNTLPDEVPRATLYPPPGYFIHSCKSLLVTNNYEFGTYAINCKSTDPCDVLIQRGVNLNKGGYFPGAVDKLHSHYTGLMEVTGNPALHFQLMEAPMLLRSPMQSDDILQVVMAAAARLGLHVYVVDCILFDTGLDINDDANAANIVSSGFLCTDKTTPHCTYVNKLDAIELRNGPGFIFLDNLDCLLDIIDEQQEKGAAFNVEQSKILGNINKLQKRFESFFSSLYTDINRDNLYHECVYTMASTQIEKRQGSAMVNRFLRDVFVVEMVITGYSSEEEVVTKLHQDILMPEKYSYTGDTISKIAKQIFSDGGGTSSMHRIASKCIHKSLCELLDGKPAHETAMNKKLQLKPIDLLIDIKKKKKQADIFKGGKVSWDDIGGLEHVKTEIINVIQLPLLRPELFPPGAPMRRGILLFGPPGTGKTMLAKAVASECNISFISIKGPELLDPYIGESEKNIRDVFQKALLSAPCVLFFDELDSIATRRGSSGSGGSGGVMDRIVSQLLTELDRVFKSASTGAGDDSSSSNLKGIYFIGATNRPDLLDPSLLRKGRLDLKIYLPVNKDAGNRLKVLSTCCRKVSLSSDVNLGRIADSLPSISTGADISSLVSQAYSHALRRKIDQLLRDYYQQRHNVEKDLATIDIDDITPEFKDYVNTMTDQELDVCIEQQDLLLVCSSFKPSVSEQDLEFYDELGKKYSDL